MTFCAYCGVILTPGVERVCDEQGGDPAGTWYCSEGERTEGCRLAPSRQTRMADKPEPTPEQVMDALGRGMEICDDCHEEYAGPVYYSFGDGESPCTVEIDGIPQPHNCTFNTCPDCTGPFMEPDDEGDPRRPVVDFFAHMIVGEAEFRSKEVSA